jgi:hypothetical protein
MKDCVVISRVAIQRSREMRACGVAFSGRVSAACGSEDEGVRLLLLLLLLLFPPVLFLRSVLWL